jgi:hypothetical protein
MIKAIRKSAGIDRQYETDWPRQFTDWFYQYLKGKTITIPARLEPAVLEQIRLR